MSFMTINLKSTWLRVFLQLHSSAWMDGQNSLRVGFNRGCSFKSSNYNGARVTYDLKSIWKKVITMTIKQTQMWREIRTANKEQGNP